MPRIPISATGSANNIARSFGLHLPDPDDQNGERVDLAARVLGGIACPWHAGRVHPGGPEAGAPRLFFESVGFGAIAAAMDGGGKDLHGLPKILAGRAALADALAAGRPQRCRLTLGDRVVALRSLLVEIPCLPWPLPALDRAAAADRARAVARRPPGLCGHPARPASGGGAGLAGRSGNAGPCLVAADRAPYRSGRPISFRTTTGPVRVDDAQLAEDAAGRPFAFDPDPFQIRPDPFRILTDPDI
ncbi:hypothetical protein [Tistrella mobilis]|uniref:hypothetical protein n=1 Tax=Tistrella mobilis TaxID=171437 RepID=UPI0035566335